MKIALITLSGEGLEIARLIRGGFPEAQIYAHESAITLEGEEAVPFSKAADLVRDLFDRCQGLVFVGPCGIAVRAAAPLVRDKKRDPAVVVIDVGGRFVISLLSGHEGGANRLAVELANLICAEPVISTTAEAKKNVIVGVGCKKGIATDEVTKAIRLSLEEAGAALSEVRYIASVDFKLREKGLVDSATALGVPFRVVSSEEIRKFLGAFERSDFVMEKIGLPGVAEPAAVLAGRRTRLILKKRTYNGVTVAVARESSIS